MIVLRGRWGRAIDRFVVRLTGYSPMTKQYALARRDAYQPTLVLTTTGRRSGRQRSSAVAYHPHHGRLIVVGTHGGAPHDPAWVDNLRANPVARVHVRRGSRTVVARLAEGDEREQLYSEVTEARPNVARYQARASGYGRTLPFVVLASPDGQPLP